MASSKAACVVCRSHSEAIRHHTPVGEVVDIRDGRGDGHGGVIVPGPLTAWAKEMGLEKEWLWDENLKATELAPLRYVMNERHGLSYTFLLTFSLSLRPSSESVDTRSFHTANEFSSSKTDDDKKRTDSTPKKGDRDKKNKNEAYTPPGDWMQKLLGRGGGRS